MSETSDRHSAFDMATLEFYETQAPDYIASGKDGTSRWLSGFVAMLPPGAHVLELGCGGGRDAEAMIAHGLIVEPTDGVAAMAAQAERRLGRPVRVMRFDELNAVQRYDAVWANASLLHVPREALRDVLHRIYRSLRPGGWHFASYKAKGAAARDGVGRYFNHPDRSFLMETYSRSGDWTEVSTIDFVGGGYEGGSGPWIAVTARRTGVR